MQALENMQAPPVSAGKHASAPSKRGKTGKHRKSGDDLGTQIHDFYFTLQLKKDLEDVNAYKNKIKESNKKLEEKVKELEQQLTKNKSKVKSQKVQIEQLRKAQKAKDVEEEGAKEKTEVRKSKTKKDCFVKSRIIIVVIVKEIIQ